MVVNTEWLELVQGSTYWQQTPGAVMNRNDVGDVVTIQLLVVFRIAIVANI